MVETLGLPLLFFGVAAVFAALGQGGGAFYVPLLLATGVPFHQAAAASQSVIVAVSASAMLIFHRAGFVDWKLVLLIEPATNLGAVLGGYLSQYVPEPAGKAIFAGVIVVGAFFMLRPMVEHTSPPKRGFCFWNRTLGGESYSVNWVVTVPLMVLVGFVSGMLGVGGGLLKVPMMVLACRIPMKVAVGSSALMVGLTALTGLAGHAAAGHFEAGRVLPLAAAGFLGAQVGSRASLSVDKRHLKRAFGILLLGIAIWMTWSVVSHGPDGNLRDGAQPTHRPEGEEHARGQESGVGPRAEESQPVARESRLPADLPSEGIHPVERSAGRITPGA